MVSCMQSQQDGPTLGGSRSGSRGLLALGRGGACLGRPLAGALLLSGRLQLLGTCRRRGPQILPKASYIGGCFDLVADFTGCSQGLLGLCKLPAGSSNHHWIDSEL